MLKRLFACLMVALVAIFAVVVMPALVEASVHAPPMVAMATVPFELARPSVIEHVSDQSPDRYMLAEMTSAGLMCSAKVTHTAHTAHPLLE